MTADQASAADLDVARVLHAALGTYLASNGVALNASEPLLYSPEEAKARLGLESTNQLYRKTADGTWPYTDIGGLKKFSEENLRAIVKIQNRDAISKASLQALRAA